MCNYLVCLLDDFILDKVCKQNDVIAVAHVVQSAYFERSEVGAVAYLVTVCEERLNALLVNG
jgi:hypothetical protein